MGRRIPPSEFITGISVPDITIESTLGSTKRAIFLDQKQIIGHMILTNPDAPHYEIPKWVMQSLDKEIQLDVPNQYIARTMLAFWMATEAWLAMASILFRSLSE